MRILLITANYRPLIDPNAIRWSALASHWAAEGHEVKVLCTRRSFLPVREYLQGVEIIRSGAYTLRDYLADLFSSSRGRRGADGQTKASPGWLERLADQYWRNWYWPDGALLWHRPALRQARILLKDWMPDAMISVCWPFTAHRIAAAIAREYPRIHWTCDYEDPFALSEAFPPNNFRRYSHRNRLAESALLQTADACTFTCEAARQAYISFYPELPLAQRSRVIPPLNCMEALAAASPQKDALLRIGYFGAFYHAIREPDLLISCLAELAANLRPQGRQLELTLAGADPVFRSRFLRLPGVRLVWRGQLGRTDLLRAMSQQDLLLSLGNTTAYHLPSKSVELLASGKPILHIWQNKSDPVLQLYQGQPGIFSWPGDAEALTNWSLQEAEQGPVYRRQHLEAFSLPAIAEGYLATLI